MYAFSAAQENPVRLQRTSNLEVPVRVHPIVLSTIPDREEATITSILFHDSLQARMVGHAERQRRTQLQDQGLGLVLGIPPCSL